MKALLQALLLVSFSFSPFYVFSQARIVINNNAYVRLNGGTAGTPVYVVVENGNANAVSTTGSGGNWVSESEWNILKWNISTNTGTYVVPYTSNPATTNFKYPLSVQITSAGTGAGSINFSSYETTTDMNIPWASLVTHMTDADNPPADNSLKVVDRYWIIDANNYGTKPDVNISFGYVDNASEIGGTNSIVESSLVAQRWNSSGNVWEGNNANTAIMYGTANAATNQVTGVDIPPSELWEVWVLVDKSSLLPVELINLDGNCVHGNVQLIWSTASETNTDKFIIEKSFNGIDYFEIGFVQAAGNSNSVTNYSFSDNGNSQMVYYRIKQMDLNGQYSYFPTININSCSDLSDNISVYSDNNGMITINYLSESDAELQMELYTIEGKLVLQNTNNVLEGNNHFTIPTNVATGIYFVIIKNNNDIFNQKIYLK